MLPREQGSDWGLSAQGGAMLLREQGLGRGCEGSRAGLRAVGRGEAFPQRARAGHVGPDALTPQDLVLLGEAARFARSLECTNLFDMCREGRLSIC
jgi:hypothetical protein